MRVSPAQLNRLEREWLRERRKEGVEERVQCGLGGWPFMPPGSRRV